MKVKSHNNQTNEQHKGFDPTTTIIFDDSIIEIEYNDLLKTKPYLVKLHRYISEYMAPTIYMPSIHEVRMSGKELRGLAEFINCYLDKRYEQN